MRALKAAKVSGYVIEPNREEPNRKWEGFHTTNPAAIRLSCDRRVFLGYRAGGDDDRTYWSDTEIWGSSLGMAIMDERGERVEQRLPLPIMKHFPRIPLPKSADEYSRYAQNHADEMLMLHDFRLFEYGAHLYVVYHVSGVVKVYDCVVRMRTQDFVARIEASIRLAAESPSDLEARWTTLWWASNAWEPCGVDGTPRIFPSEVMKGDIVYFPAADGTLQLCHRPLPDIAVFANGDRLHASATPDGITRWGVPERSVRPGYTDNSHIGSNGNPTRAMIGDVEVWLDVLHGCHNECVANPVSDGMWISYYPYLRVKDAETLDLLYYSEEPILDFDEVWREYTIDGAWVRRNPILHGVMFAGGQLETIPGQNGIDDEFSTYLGVGDTAVARATFRLRDLIPEAVLADIQVRKTHRATPVNTPSNDYDFDETLSGWRWSIDNDPASRSIRVTRRLEKNGYREEEACVFNTRPGYFDADAALFDGASIRYIPRLGWLLLYKGVRWDEQNGKKTSSIGVGVLLLDLANPQRVLYRSLTPIDGMTIESGWTLGESVATPSLHDLPIEQLVPDKVRNEILRTRDLAPRGLAWPVLMEEWLRKKAAFWDTHWYNGVAAIPMDKKPVSRVAIGVAYKDGKVISDDVA